MASEGIETRHQRKCRSHAGGRCSCQPSFRASVWSPRDGKLIRRTSRDRNVVKTWRQDASVAVRQGTMKAPTSTTLEQAAEEWLEKARTGAIRNRAGDPFKPSSLRAYETAFKQRVLPRFGRCRLADIRTVDLQEFVDKMVADGLAESTITCTLNPLRSIYRRGVQRGELATNPTLRLDLPAVRGGRDRIVTPGEAEKLITALPTADRAVWATAMYAGLRRGELRALRAKDIDVATGIVWVRRGWDDVEGPVKPKGGVERKVPLASVLKEMLLAELMRTGRRDDDLIFGETVTAPLNYRRLSERADKAWKAAELERVTLHEARHCCATYLIHAGLNLKALASAIGHTDVRTTLNVYGHLLPNGEAEAAGLLDAYLTRSTGTEDR